jgi:pimeloyl-ACP methyl ester carboxylesterase
MARNTRAILQKLGIDKVMVVGHSTGRRGGHGVLPPSIRQ